MSAQTTQVTTQVFRWNDLPVKSDTQRESRKMVEGTTDEFSYFEIHATTQYQGALPRPPHDQKDIEELIIVSEGLMQCTIGDQSAVLGAGSVLLIPPLEKQTFENIGEGPLTYYVFMFRSKKTMDLDRSKLAGHTLLISPDTLMEVSTNKRSTIKYFDRPSTMTQNFELHSTTLFDIGPSHTPHTHVDTEMVLVIDGTLQITVDEKQYDLTTGDLMYIERNKMHGIANNSTGPCTYFAFKWRE